MASSTPGPTNSSETKSNKLEKKSISKRTDKNPTNLIQNPSSPWTALKGPMKEQKKIKFFGFRFMTIWVFPTAIMGTLMEFLFISPIRNTLPFG